MDNMVLEYPFKFKKIKATFLERINRFVIKARIKNEEIFAYLPNSGRLWELLLPGKELLLLKNKKTSISPYTVLACKHGSHYVLLHTHLTNKIIKKLVAEGKLGFWKDYKILKEEVKLNSSRFDFLLGNKYTSEKMVLEVKTCTLFGKEIAMFPDAETKRGTRHILELAELQKEGLRGGILFVVMNPEINYFLPAYHIDYQFSKALLEKREDIEVKAVAIKWEKTFTFVEEIKKLQIPFRILEKIEDKGIYLLVFELKNREKIKIGSLGEKIFDNGFYVYVGSAMKNLTKRINRHFRKNKKTRWHIDYLVPKGHSLKAIPIRTSNKLECEIAKALSLISDDIISGFGASDCRCGSHLFYFSENPFNKRDFQKLIIEYRINKINID
ncbi:MAG: DNA-binding protein [Thermodesulfobacterium sp.]|uniref:DNA-binding protein n=1 Tax=Candidatus Thermodesulfobacterium syntrophicum TaxID=3060442 RepID=A0AAE3P4T9_9BACT|nr:DNA-binding protein [Candidatus Thermodesulfobacterium syntrophicum]